MGLKRMRMGRVMVIRPPFVKVVGNVIASRVGRGILKVDHNKLLISSACLAHPRYDGPVLLAGCPNEGDCRTAYRCLPQ